MNPLLELRHIGYGRHGAELLSPVSLQLNAGEQLFVTGPSGSGKSTLLKIIASLLEPTTGSLLFRGEPVAGLRPEQYRRQVSYCFQTPTLFGETVRDNLAFPWLIRGEKADPLRLQNGLERVGLSGDWLDKQIGPLSGGEKQRIALLRNLQFLPDILLLDEITSALDEESRQLTIGLIDEAAAQGAAAIWVTHDKAEIARAQRLITLPGSARSDNESA